MNDYNVYSSDLKLTSRRINRFDILLLALVCIGLWIFAQTGSQMAIPYSLGEPIQISLSPMVLPQYALRTVIRMFIALFFSIIVSMIKTTTRKAVTAPKINTCFNSWKA
jgi:NitT/TauT family transport system permease protein